MIRAVVFAAFVARISAQTCVPPVITHTETGDDLYRALLCDLNNVENKAAQIAAAAQGDGGCTKMENIDFFTQLLITITADNTWLDKLGAGTSTPTANECEGVTLRIDFDLKNIQLKATVPVNSAVCPPTSGAALSQYTLQEFGRTLTALTDAPDDPSPTPPGKWEKYVQDLKFAILAVQGHIIIDDSSICLSTAKTLANALVGIRTSCGGPTSTTAYSG